MRIQNRAAMQIRLHSMNIGDLIVLNCLYSVRPLDCRTIAAADAQSTPFAPQPLATSPASQSQIRLHSHQTHLRFRRCIRLHFGQIRRHQRTEHAANNDRHRRRPSRRRQHRKLVAAGAATLQPRHVVRAAARRARLVRPAL